MTPPAGVAAGLLDYLRTALREPGLEFAEPPAPITGGFDTRIFAFRLRDGPGALAGPLILRLLGPQHDPARVLGERATQNALAALGYPAPRVPLATTEVAPLGGAFLVMERVPGKALPEARFFHTSRMLAAMQLRLHALDGDVLLRALDAGGVASVSATFDGYLARLEDRVARRSLDGLAPAVRWLVEHRPPEKGQRVICHGDFHPYNILVSGGTVTGVIDWPNTILADPVYDVASTKIILGLVPVELSALPAPLRWLARGARRLLVGRYLAGYRRHRPVDPRTLPYYEAAACMRGLLRAAESRLNRASAAAPPPANPLDASAYPERLARHVARITGITPALPPASG